MPFALATGSRFAALFVLLNAVGAFCLSRRSVSHQVLGQGIALTLAATHAGALLVALRRPALFGSITVMLAMLGLVAVFAGLPFWRSRVAQERFAPLVSRSAFLAGALGSVAVAARLSLTALRDLTQGQWYFALASTLLAAMLVAQATAVVRMRGWGVLLATATGASCVVPALVLRGGDSFLCALAVAASACLVVPVLAGRRSGVRPVGQERVALRLSAMESERARAYERAGEQERALAYERAEEQERTLAYERAEEQGHEHAPMRRMAPERA